MASDLSSVFFFLISDQGNFFTDTHNTTVRVEEKNNWTNTNLGQLLAKEGGILCDTVHSVS